MYVYIQNIAKSYNVPKQQNNWPHYIHTGLFGGDCMTSKNLTIRFIEKRFCKIIVQILALKLLSHTSLQIHVVAYETVNSQSN